MRDLLGILIGAVLLTLLMAYLSKGPESKYKIIAADHTYYCNQFTYQGRTVYFKDINGDSICITGDFTLIYERDKDDN